jgi:MATE family multidrug resistance protein
MHIDVAEFYGRTERYIVGPSILGRQGPSLLFRVNGDVFVRTFLLTLVTTFFTFVSSGMGDLILAATHC